MCCFWCVAGTYYLMRYFGMSLHGSKLQVHCWTCSPQRVPADVQAVEDEDLVVNVDCQDMRKFDVELYSQLVAYPMEVIPLLDAETNDVVVDQFGPETAEQLGPIMVGVLQADWRNLASP